MVSLNFIKYRLSNIILCNFLSYFKLNLSIAYNLIQEPNKNFQAPTTNTNKSIDMPTNINQNILDHMAINNPLNSNLNSNLNTNINTNSPPNMNISGISYNNTNEIDETLNLDLDPLASLDTANRIQPDQITTSTSFQSHRTSEPLGLDINKFIQSNNPDETIHEVSQTQDIPLIQSINDQHSAVKSAILKRFNSLKMLSKWWSESNISSAIKALNMMKDVPVINDFFNYAFIQREDISKMPLSFDHAISIIPHIMLLINSKYEAYCRNGCRAGMILLRMFNEKIALLRSDYSEGREARMKKCDEIIELFDKMYKSQNLEKLIKRKNNETSQLASGLYTDLEFFMKLFKK